MSEALGVEELSSWIEARHWESCFEAGVVVAGGKIVGARLISSVAAELLDTGDVELRGIVAEKSGATFEPIVAVWREGGVLTLEGDCQCSRRLNCEHAAALLVYLAKSGERLERAMGGAPHVDRMLEGKLLAFKPEPAEEPSTSVDEIEPSFLLSLIHI